jgi:FtsP/CotA-like multicopper oxidase with cupredoxin domain
MVGDHDLSPSETLEIRSKNRLPERRKGEGRARLRQRSFRSAQDKTDIEKCSQRRASSLPWPGSALPWTVTCSAALSASGTSPTWSATAGNPAEDGGHSSAGESGTPGESQSGMPGERELEAPL